MYQVFIIYILYYKRNVMYKKLIKNTYPSVAGVFNQTENIFFKLKKNLVFLIITENKYHKDISQALFKHEMLLLR